MEQTKSVVFCVRVFTAVIALYVFFPESARELFLRRIEALHRLEQEECILFFTIGAY